MTGPLSYRNQSIDLLHKSMEWFLYDNGLRHERVKAKSNEKKQLEDESINGTKYWDIDSCNFVHVYLYFLSKYA